MQVIGHRGAAALAPENTWTSFDVALEIGVDAIEMDVQATNDGELVIIHDACLDRTTNGKGLVHQTPWSVISALDAGEWFNEKYQGVRVPRLRDTLKRYGKLTHIVLEIKQQGIERQVLKTVQELGIINQVTFTSFEFNIAQQLKELNPNIKAGFLTPDSGLQNIRRVVDAHLEQFCPQASALSKELVAMCNDMGLEVRVWGVKNTELMMKAIEAGVDGMTVDFPHLLLEALNNTFAN